MDSKPRTSGLKMSTRNITKVKIAKNKKRFATVCPFGQFVLQNIFLNRLEVKKKNYSTPKLLF